MSRPKAPCGTQGAHSRHRRNNEPIDDLCRRWQQENSKGRRVPLAGNVTVVANTDGSVAVTFHDPMDARITAAAVSDRAISLKLAPALHGGTRAAADRAALIHKRIAAGLRAAGVMP